MTLLADYQKLVASGEIFAEPQQLAVIEKLQSIIDGLTAKNGTLFRRKKIPPKGLYLWGGVGIGKTLLLDTFYYSLPFKDKWRTHFLPFMRDVHAQLHALQGTSNPLWHLAKQWAQKTRVICFDEFLVEDIADALLLGGLLDALFQQGICIIFTSNFAPNELYENGLQRELFLPAIEKIQQHTQIVHLTINNDYRVSTLPATDYYWYPLTTAVRDKLQRSFQQYSHQGLPTIAPLRVCGRDIRIIQKADGVVWFDFLAICGIPRSYEDYLVIAKQFHTVLVSNIVAIGAHENDLARSFIQLVDVFYAAKIRLIISAALPIEQIYTQGRLLFEFDRTKSRLLQMQSAQWQVDKK